VVASLWKVPDAATAALMGEFYRNLWDAGLPPIEALRRAQLAVYRADPKQFADLARRGPGLGDEDFDKVMKVIEKSPINKNGKNPPIVWAAWALSGPGR
jgi:CHAT domain-containing protein